MSDFNENNSQNDISENISSEPETNLKSPENNSEVTFEPVAENGPEIISGAEAVKKSPAKIIAVIAVIIVLLFGCCFGAYAFIPQVKNQVKMIVNSPEEYFKWVYTQDIENTNKLIADAIYNQDETESDFKGNLKIDLEKEAIEKYMTENSGKSFEDNGMKLPSSVNMDIKMAKMDDYQAVNADITADGNPLIKENIYLKDNKYYLQYPDISSSYLCFDFIGLMKTSLEAEGNEQASEILSPVIDNLTEDSEAQLLTRDEFEDIFNRYFEIVINDVENVEMEKDSECEASGIKGKYTKLVAKFDMGTCYSVVRDILTEAQNDEVIAKLLEENSKYTKEDFKNAVGNLLDQFKGLEVTGGNTAFVMNTYVNNKGEIVGANIDNIGYTDEAEETGFADEFSIGLFTANNGNDYGFSAFVEIDEERYSIDGTAKENAGKFTGDASVLSEGEKVFGLTFDNLEFADNGELINGSVTLGLSSFGIDDLKIDFESDGNKHTIKSDITIGGTKYAAITYDITREQPDSITIFSDDAKVYNINDGMEQYYQDGDMQSLIDNICDVFGIDPELLTRGGYLENNADFNDLDEDFLIDSDYDIDGLDDVDTENLNIKYDLSKVKIQFNNSDIKLPGKIEGIYDKVKFEKDKVASNTTEYGYSDDYGTFVGVYNNTDKEANIKDCDISYISVTADSTDKLTIDGIGVGDDIKKAADKYGYELSDPKSGFIELENDGDGFGYIDISYESGKIYEIAVYFG